MPHQHTHTHVFIHSCINVLLTQPQLTNTLQRKLDEVRREKSQLERQIEHEKKANASLQTQLIAMRGTTKLVPANAEALEEEEEMEEED